MTTVALFNNKGGVGKTTLTYHLAWKLYDMGYRVLAVDLDPQANLSAMFLDDERLETLWPDAEHTQSIYGVISPLVKGLGDIAAPHVELIDERPELGLLVGDLKLSLFEDRLSDAWPRCLDQREDALRTSTAFARAIATAKATHKADIVLVDVGPNFGAINRAALLAADRVLVPLVPDLFSLQGLRNLGPTLRDWRGGWSDRRGRNLGAGFTLPTGEMQPIGYVVHQHSMRRYQANHAYRRWLARIPETYRAAVLNVEPQGTNDPDNDEHCLASLKHYRSLVPLAMEARKPMFSLKPADGAIGAHMEAVRSCGRDFQALAKRVLMSVGLSTA